MSTATITNDRLDRLRGKYVSQIQAKEEEIKTLRSKLVLIDELEAEADEEPRMLFKISEMPPRSVPGNTTIPAANLTQTILHAVHILGRAVRPPDVREYLLSNGHQPVGKNFAITVGTTLKRLATQGKLTAETTPQGTAYKVK